MRDVIYLAWKYLAYHRLKSAVLIASVALLAYLPAGLSVLIDQGSQQLTARAEVTPLIVGAKGSPLELTLRSLYFESDVPDDMRFLEAMRIGRSGLATAIPLHARFRTRQSPIVGTSLEYFDYRGLRLAKGRRFGRLGDCVLGARAAQMENVGPGESVLSAAENVFDLAGVYPLKMRVVGVLEPTGTPDDRAVFIDLKTAWIIAGLGHGHQDLQTAAAAHQRMGREKNNLIADGSEVHYNEITAENIRSFHFHGKVADFPITSAIAVPRDARSGTLLQGRYLGEDERVQIVRPATVLNELLATVLTVRRYMLMAFAVVGVATLASLALVFTLSWQLRRREIETMIKIGASPWRVTSVLAVEVLGVVVAGFCFAAALTLATYWMAASAGRLLIQLT